MTAMFVALMVGVILMPVLVGMLFVSNRLLRDEDRDHETGIGWWD